MVKIILASHHRMAEGLKDTLDYILPVHEPVKAISAYLTNDPVDKELNEALSDAAPEDQVLIFTDMMGGSVNQACFPLIAGNPNIHVIAGMNLPIVLSLTLKAAAGSISPEEISSTIEECKEQMIYVNQALQASGEDEEDE